MQIEFIRQKINLQKKKAKWRSKKVAKIILYLFFVCAKSSHIFKISYAYFLRTQNSQCAIEKIETCYTTYNLYKEFIFSVRVWNPVRFHESRDQSTRRISDTVVFQTPKYSVIPSISVWRRTQTQDNSLPI